MLWSGPLPIGPADIDITDTTTGVPVWLLLLAVVGSWAGGAFTSWVTRRRDRASNEQQMIDQLQEEVRSLRNDLAATRAELSVTQADMRAMRLRDIAWISYTADLMKVAIDAGADPPPMPIELRTAPPVTPVVT